MAKMDRHSSDSWRLADTMAIVGGNSVNMIMIENRISWVVLCVGFGLFALGHIVAGFLLAVCVALFLGSRINSQKPPSPRPFSMPDENWAVACEERCIPVQYSTCAMDNVMRFMAGQSQEVELKPDEHAQSSQHVAVYGRWTDTSGCQQQRKLGHIPVQEVEELYSETRNRPECRVSAKISEIFVPSNKMTFPGLALDIALLEPSS
jgi:hypothetical protein